MKDKNQKHFLDDTVKRAKIENAHREAENIIITINGKITMRRWLIMN